MPPQLSDDGSIDSDGPDAIPAKGKIPTTKADEVQEQAGNGNDDEDDDEESEEDEYRVEKILAHEWDPKGNVLYHIKWLGYNHEDDLTWEPIEHLSGAKEILEEYHEQIGGAPEPKSSKKKGGKAGKRNASSAALDSPTVEANGSKKRGRKSNGTTAAAALPASQKPLPEGLWEEAVLRVASIIEQNSDPVAPGSSGKIEKKLFGLVEWRDGGKTQHPLEALRRKCPQKLIDYYEQHL